METRYIKKLDIQLVDSDFINPLKGQMRDPEQVYDTFRDIKNYAMETAIAVYLTEQLEVITYAVISVGGQDATLMLPEEIFGLAYTLRSRNIILVHNHPSGNATPSPEDRVSIAQIKTQAVIMKRTIIDFMVIGDMRDTEKKDYWSMFAQEHEGGYASRDVS